MSGPGLYYWKTDDFPAVFQLVQKFKTGVTVRQDGQNEADALAKLNAWVRPAAQDFLGFAPPMIEAAASSFRPFTQRKVPRT